MYKFKNYHLSSIVILLALILQVVSLSAFAPQAAAATEDEISLSLDKVLAYYNSQESYDDWEALGLSWTGVETSSKYAGGETVSASDYARSILGSIAADCSAEMVDGYIQNLENMQTEEGNFNNEENSSLNQTIWPLIALNFAANNNYDVDYNEETAVSYIVSQQDASGGFDESGWGVDVDSTAHVLIALAPYKEANAEVINNALSYLKEQQAPSGVFNSWGAASPDSTAAVIEALVALGEDPQNPGGQGWQGNMVDALLAYQLESGAFYSPWAPEEANAMTSRNALLALGDAADNKSKYQNAMPGDRSLSMSIEAASSFQLDSDAKMILSLSNTADSVADVLAIAALFNIENESMINYTYLNRELAANETVVFGCGFTIPSSGEYEVRVYTWDNWEDRNSLLSPVVIPVN